MSKCSACIIAAVNPRTGRYDAGCMECSARALAQSPQYADAAMAEAITVGYRDRLMNTFGDDWRIGHARIKAWVEQFGKAKA